MKGDVNWYGVLAHHAARSPDRAITVFEGTVTTYGDMEARAADAPGQKPPKPPLPDGLGVGDGDGDGDAAGWM